VKSCLRYMCLLLLGLLAASISSACTQPPILSRTYSWSPGALVVVNHNDADITSELQTAMTSWNVGLTTLAGGATACDPPQFIFSSGNASINLTVGTIPAQLTDPGGNDAVNVGTTTVSVARGLTDLRNATLSGSPSRLSKVNMYMNSGVTAAAAITEVLAHELGHTLALGDCYAPSPCAYHSSVMNSQQPNSALLSGGLNASLGEPGPTICDIVSVASIAIDYGCADTPPTSGDCQPCINSASLSGGKPRLLKVQAGLPCCASAPIVIDVSGKGFVLTSAQDGVKFDISGTGDPVQMGWTAPGADNAFLALPGPDKLVHNGQQLFGNFTPQPPGTHNGFAALAVYDQPAHGGNGDGIIDNRDAILPRCVCGSTPIMMAYRNPRNFTPCLRLV
jgi:hypothetical protein